MNSKILLIATVLLAGTSLASAQPGAAYQDRGEREQDVGVHKDKAGFASTTMRHHAKARVRHHASRRAARPSTTGRGLPPGGKYQDIRENESEGKTPDGRL